MKKLLILPLLFLSMPSVAEELRSHAAIEAAIVEAKSIRIMVDFSQCIFNEQNKMAQQLDLGVGIYTPNEIIFNKQGIAASLSHFTVSRQHNPKKAVYQFARYHILANDEVHISTQELDAVTFEPVTPEFQLSCPLNSATRVFSVN